MRLEDRSDRECDAFARDVSLSGLSSGADCRYADLYCCQVRIRGFHSIGAQNAGGFVVFDIEIVTREVRYTEGRSRAALGSALTDGRGGQGTIMRIHKRYSAFSRLRGHLIEAFPHLRPLIPRLPPKSTLCA